MKVKNRAVYVNPRTVGTTQVNLQNDVESSVGTEEQSGAAAMMNYLKQTYKHIDFNFMSFDNNRQIAQYGAGQKGINNVSISAELLEKMSADEKVRQQVENILQHLSDYQNAAKFEALLCDKKLVGMGLVIDEDGEVSRWTAMQEKKKEDYPTWWRDEKSTSFYSTKVKTPKSKGYSFSHASNMMRLAGARDVRSVKSLISAKYGEIQRVKLQVADSAEAAAIVRKIRAVIQSGNIKVARLHKEENLQLRQKSAEKKMKEKLARQLAQELRRKQKARMGQEYCQSQAAHMSDLIPRQNMTDEQFKQIAEQYVESLSPTALAAESASMVDCTVSSGVSVEVMSAPVTSVVDCSA
ncbi:MAG: hypothetical protein HFG92_14150 [Dorea sp.]|nr:hypothetical protein [Dorea sp.]